MSEPAVRAHAWLPRATCDADCLHAGGRQASRRVIVALRVARRFTLLLLFAPALPLLAVVLPGWSKSRKIYCRLLLWCLGVRDHVVRRTDPQSARCAGGQRPHVVAGHFDDRRGASVQPVAGIAAVVCRPRRRGGQLRRADDGSHRAGDPDRAGQVCGNCPRWSPPSPRASTPVIRWWRSPRAPPGVDGPATIRAARRPGEEPGNRAGNRAWPGDRIRARGRSIRRCSRRPSTPADQSSRCGCATTTGTAGSRLCRPSSATTHCCVRSAG